MYIEENGTIKLTEEGHASYRKYIDTLLEAMELFESINPMELSRMAPGTYHHLDSLYKYMRYNQKVSLCYFHRNYKSYRIGENNIDAVPDRYIGSFATRNEDKLIGTKALTKYMGGSIREPIYFNEDFPIYIHEINKVSESRLDDLSYPNIMNSSLYIEITHSFFMWNGPLFVAHCHSDTYFKQSRDILFNRLRDIGGGGFTLILNNNSHSSLPLYKRKIEESYGLQEYIYPDTIYLNNKEIIIDEATNKTKMLLRGIASLDIHTIQVRTLINAIYMGMNK